MTELIIIFALMGLLMYVMYINGYLMINAKRAVMYIGSRWGKRASFASCSGYTKRMIKFEEEKTYNFNLVLELTKGDVTVEIQGPGRQCLLKLSDGAPKGSIAVEKGKRYYMVVRFQAASGNYEIDWE